MFKKIYWSTIKGITRNHVGRTSLVFVFLVCFFLHLMYKTGPISMPFINYIPMINGCFTWTLTVILLSLLPIIAVSIMQDKDYAAYDVELATGMKQRTYLSAKFLGIFSIFLVLSVLMPAVNFLSLYVLNPNVMKTDIPFLETVTRFAVGYLYFTVPIGMCIFGLLFLIMLAFQNKALGIVLGAVYILGAIFIQHRYFSIPPSKIEKYFTSQTKGDLKLLLMPDNEAVVQVAVLLGIGLLAVGLTILLLPRFKKNIFD